MMNNHKDEAVEEPEWEFEESRAEFVEQFLQPGEEISWVSCKINEFEGQPVKKTLRKNIGNDVTFLVTTLDGQKTLTVGTYAPERKVQYENPVEMMKCATTFVLTEKIVRLPGKYQPQIIIEKRNDDLWVVLVDRDCLNNAGELEHEPSPSNRDDNFLTRTRFSFEEAWKRAEKFIKVNKYKKC